MRETLLDDAPDGLDHRRDGSLVVGPEDRPRRVPDDAVLDDGLDRPLRRHGVQMGAKEERDAAAVRGRQGGVQIPDLRAGLRAGRVLVDVEAQLPELGDDSIRDGALAPRR